MFLANKVENYFKKSGKSFFSCYISLERKKRIRDKFPFALLTTFSSCYLNLLIVKISFSSLYHMKMGLADCHSLPWCTSPLHFTTNEFFNELQSIVTDFHAYLESEEEEVILNITNYLSVLLFRIEYYEIS